MEKTKRHRFSARERKQVFDMFEGHCAYCGCEVTFRGMQMDHKEPLYIGGEDKIEIYILPVGAAIIINIL